MSMESRSAHFVKIATQLCHKYIKMIPYSMDINTMLLENPEDFPVKYHVWTKRKSPGIIIDSTIKQFRENSDICKEMPSE